MGQSGADNRKGSITRNISYNTIITVVKYVTEAVCMMYISRKLQPTVNGKVDYATSVVNYFTMFALLGMPVYAIRCCARVRDDREKLTKVFSELFTMGVILSAVVGAVLAGLCFTVNPFRSNRALMLILGSAIVWNAIGCEWLYKGLERYRYLMFVSLITRVTALVLIVLMVRSPEDMLLYAWLLIAPVAVSSVCNFILLRREVAFPCRPSWNAAHLKPLLIFFAMSCMTTIYVNLDIVMLGAMRGDYETGLYGLVSKGKILLVFFGGVLWAAVLPQATEAWSKGEKQRFRDISHRSVQLIATVNFALLAFSFVYAKECVLAMGGASYLEATDAFRIMILSVAPIGLSNVLGGLVMIPSGREKRLLQAEIAGAVLNFALNLYVIPRYSIEGAATTTVLAEVLVWLLCFWFDRREIHFSIREMMPSLRTVLAVALAAVPAYFIPLPDSSVFLRLAIAAVIYFGSYAVIGLVIGEPVIREVVGKIFRRR